MRLTAGAVSQVAYSASMNSYMSLTDAPPRSTPRLLKESQLSSSARDSRVPAHEGGHARIAAAAAPLPHASHGRPAPSYRDWSHSHRARGLPQQSAVTSRSPSAPLPHETQVRTSGIFLTLDPVLSGEDPIRIRSPETSGHPSFSLAMRMSRSEPLLSGGTRQSRVNRG